ncbi:MAG: carbamoyltransferase HypF [Verrucomicrobiae bacterium]|nr:carbamoyltransferase HypF [Verrucomicrobiae bacterium]
MTEYARHRLEIIGAVQGVGFRPFVSRLASELGLAGWVCNSLAGLDVEIEGPAEACAVFLRQVRGNPPPHARVRSVTESSLPLEGVSSFVIRESQTAPPAAATTEIVPDLATCVDCVREIFDSANRRHGYPFTNCTQCGPRFSIVRSLPYDRARTTMHEFTMCSECRAEYESPSDRRFHAQPNACPKCGPRLAFADAPGRVLAHREEALERAARAIEAGQVIAVKGIGGYHLMADARSTSAIETLRLRKRRSAKPLAVMVPDLGDARARCEMSALEERLLTSARAPIVVLRRRNDDDLPLILAPGNPDLGVILPYSPLHHLLMQRLGFPIVVTSANVSDEPLCTDNDDAFHRLRGLADAFLIHDRPIERALDDSVVRVAAGHELVLRRARGYAPFSLGAELTPVLAVGGDQKTSIAVTGPFGVRCGPHVGDLETEAAQETFTAQCRDFPALCGVRPRAIACDAHPGYHGGRLAAGMGLPLVTVQHHHAHIAACLAEHELDEEVLGVAWDGTGHGPDGTIWGGEFLLASRREFRRLAHLRWFPLPGGELSVRQPRYAALGLLAEAGIPIEDTPLGAAFTSEELTIAHRQIQRGINVPFTSSAGRLFDAVAALLGLRWRNEFEAQAAMELEHAAGVGDGAFIPLALESGILDWEPVVRGLLEDLRNRVPGPTIAARFIDSMAHAILLVARDSGKGIVALGGGCFQNVRLLESTVARLQAEGFIALWPRQAPPNDGGLALGQAVVATARFPDPVS